MSFNQIFKAEIINFPKYKTINCHAGMLPFYRGRNILNWALINDEKEFGITVHYVGERIDTGDIILQRSYPISDEDNYATLLERAYFDCANILYDAVILFKKAFVESKKQIEVHPVGFYCSQRKMGDETLNWNQTSREIFNFVRAICFPGPMARAFINNKEMKINKVLEVKNAPSYKCITGAILSKDTNSFLVKTKDSFIKVVEFEYDGKFKVGDRFEVR
jgi:methionyl-tRNA formyltransferase